jgi:acetyl-CoA carboxylase biotin carboxyl carrier protein
MAEEIRKKRAPRIDAAEPVATAFSVSDIKELFKLMKQNEIAELNIEQQGTKVHIVSTHAPVLPHTSVSPMVPMMHGMSQMGMMNMPSNAALAAPPQPQTEAAPAPAEQRAPAAEAGLPANLKTIFSPMVGTFYRAPAPDAPPFVRVGDLIKEDTTLCIIEAMKLMNEIKAEIRGKVFRVLVENGVPVEYNQPLYLVEPE